MPRPLGFSLQVELPMPAIGIYDCFMSVLRSRTNGATRVLFDEKMGKRWHRWLVSYFGVLTLFATVAGCSGTSTESPSSLKSQLLNIQDLAAGWTAVGKGPSSGTALPRTTAESSVSCAPTARGLDGYMPEAWAAADFQSDQEHLQVLDFILYFPGRGPKVMSATTRALAKCSQYTSKGESGTVAPMSIGVSVGDQSAAYDITYSSSQTDVVLVRKGDEIALLTYLSTPSWPFPPDTMSISQITQAAADKL